MQHHIVFNYLYRDASNYKSWGGVVVRTEQSLAFVEKISCEWRGRYFCAERLGVKDLRAELWRWTAGLPNEDDHDLHEVESISLATVDDIRELPFVGALDTLLEKLKCASAVDESFAP
jgi:hypothetical protein